MLDFPRYLAKSIPRTIVASLLITACLIGGACPRPVIASQCEYSTTWFYLNNQGATHCELLAMEKALSLEVKNFHALSPLILEVGRRYDKEQESGDEWAPCLQ